MASEKLIDLRDAYVESLIEVAGANPDIVALDADVSKSTRSRKFGDKYPERFYNVGIAEMNMVGIAAGLAADGKIPFASSFGVFTVQRAAEPVRTMISYPNANVKLVGGYAGLTAGQHGPTHHTIRDISVTRCLPNFVILSPCDWVTTRKAVAAAAKHVGPVYLRLGYNKQKAVYGEDAEFEIGKAYTLREGSDLTILSTGLIIEETLKAADELRERGVNAAVVDCPTVKPLDEATILNSARKTGALLTVEDHTIPGGFGSAVAELLVRKASVVPIEFVGIDDIFTESAPYDELLSCFGPSAARIVDSGLNVVKRRASRDAVVQAS